MVLTAGKPAPSTPEVPVRHIDTDNTSWTIGAIYADTNTEPNDTCGTTDTSAKCQTHETCGTTDTSATCYMHRNVRYRHQRRTQVRLHHCYQRVVQDYVHILAPFIRYNFCSKCEH